MLFSNLYLGLEIAHSHKVNVEESTMQNQNYKGMEV
jgi:hypothetical protein